MFNVISFFEENNIEFHTSGKNVTKGWTEINCPFCSDPSFHLGINLESGLFHCWICGAKGGPSILIKRLLNVSYSEAQRIENEFTSFKKQEQEQNKEIISKIEFPKGLEKNFPSYHKEYLIKRNFDPDYIINQYQLKACLRLGGDFAYRIIIPIIIDNQIVSYTARDITEKAKYKYKHLSNEKSIIQVKDCLYNIDTVKDKCIIVEGVIDVWRIGDAAIAMFGLEYTIRQLNILFSKELKEAYVMFDSEPQAIRKANKLANTLSTFIPKVSVIELSSGDPADLTTEEILSLKAKINFV
jgi:DNA primase